MKFVFSPAYSRVSQQEPLRVVAEKILDEDAVLTGAGAGLSTAAGFTYSGDRFEQYSFAFAQKYGFTDMYSGGFYPFSTSEEMWAYRSRYIDINRYLNPPKRPVNIFWN